MAGSTHSSAQARPPHAMSRYIDAVPGSSIFHATPRHTPVSRPASQRQRELIARRSLRQIFQSDINPDPYVFSPTGSHAIHPDGSLPQLEGDVDPYTFSEGPGSDDDGRGAPQRGKPGWWVHQSVAPSGRSSRRGRDLDDPYASEGSESGKASDPESEVAPRDGRGLRGAGSVMETDEDESDSDSDPGSESGYTTTSSLVSTSTDSALSPRESLRRSTHTSGRRSVRRDPGTVPDRLEVYERASGHWSVAELPRYRGRSSHGGIQGW